MYRRFRPDRPLRSRLRRAAAVWSKGALSTGVSLLPAPRRSWKSGVEGVSERHVPRVPGQRGNRLTRRVGVPDAASWVSEAKRAR